MPTLSYDDQYASFVLDDKKLKLEEFATSPILALREGDFFTYYEAGKSESFTIASVSKIRDLWKTQLTLVSRKPEKIFEAVVAKNIKGNMISLTVDGQSFIVTDKISVYELFDLAKNRIFTIDGKEYRVYFYQYAYFSDSGYAFINFNITKNIP